MGSATQNSCATSGPAGMCLDSGVPRLRRDAHVFGAPQLEGAELDGPRDAIAHRTTASAIRRCLIRGHCDRRVGQGLSWPPGACHGWFRRAVARSSRCGGFKIEAPPGHCPPAKFPETLRPCHLVCVTPPAMMYMGGRCRLIWQSKGNQAAGWDGPHMKGTGNGQAAAGTHRRRELGGR